MKSGPGSRRGDAMHLHILGICGTFMGGLAKIARELGHTVTGCDAHVYPPMSEQLREIGIELHEGYDAAQLDEYQADLYVVGNAMTRGMPVVEAMLDRGLPYLSGPQWLNENVLTDKWVVAVAGTHGKSTTSSMLAWILEDAGLQPGFLIGGIARNFNVSARASASAFFVIEADEYDTAFFDKRSKFVWYRPRTAVLLNLEYDHADIFPDLAAIETQFHHLVRIVPRQGLVVANGQQIALNRVLARGAWTPVERFGAGEAWAVGTVHADGAFDILLDGAPQGTVRWALMGEHNRQNALAAIAAARHAGVPIATAVDALGRFEGVKRRMELRGTVDGIRVYDDFAHHPTAFETTIDGLRARVGDARIVAVFEPRSNTMKLGTMQERMAKSLAGADLVFCYARELGWDAAHTLAPLGNRASTFQEIGPMVESILQVVKPGDHVLVMSNGGFGGVHGKLLDALSAAASSRAGA
jgi:UDP-N-acetylmuramate: L-alanyl-gamma-D-glutamyl-meso-diaminopimelate ligase